MQFRAGMFTSKWMSYIVVDANDAVATAAAADIAADTVATATNDDDGVAVSFTTANDDAVATAADDDDAVAVAFTTADDAVHDAVSLPPVKKKQKRNKSKLGRHKRSRNQKLTQTQTVAAPVPTSISTSNKILLVANKKPSKSIIIKKFIICKT